VYKMKQGLPNEISRLTSVAESNLEFQGATAIEDKLQVASQSRKVEAGQPVRRMCYMWPGQYRELVLGHRVIWSGGKK
ncbi:MAG: hypothetical protein SGPRY_011252, partial [Prymnesium sp.]